MILEAAMIAVLTITPEPRTELGDLRLICGYEARLSHNTQMMRGKFEHWAQLAGRMRQVIPPSQQLQDIEVITRNVYNSYEADVTPEEVAESVYEECVDENGTKL